MVFKQIVPEENRAGKLFSLSSGLELLVTQRCVQQTQHQHSQVNFH